MSSVTIQDIKTALQAALRASDGNIDGVIDYVYWSEDLNDVYDNFVDDNGNLQKWMIGWNSLPNTQRKGGLIEERYTLNIFGIYGLKEDNTSSITFEGFIENIKQYLNSRYSILDCTTHLPVVVVGIENTVYRGAYPVHACQLQVTFIVQQDGLDDA